MKPEEQDLEPGGDGRWLAVFCLARIFYSFIFVSYSAALPLLQSDWAMSSTQAGMVQSAWHLGYLVSLFAVGFLSDRFGAKRTFLWSGVAASISGVVFAIFASGFLSGAILYGLAGLFSGGSYTPGLTLIAERFPPLQRGRAMGIFLAAGSLSYTLSIVISSLLFPIGGWHLAFLVTCSLPTAGLALSLWALRTTPNLIHAAPDGREMLRTIPAVLKNKPALLSMFAYTSHCWELLGMWAWLPAYLAVVAQTASRTEQLERAAIGIGVLLSGLTYLTSMLGSLVGGTLSDRWGRTSTLLLFSCLSLTLLPHLRLDARLAPDDSVHRRRLLQPHAIADSSIYSTALTELVEPQHIGAAYAVRSVMGFSAGAISPWVFGLVMDLVHGFPGSSERLAWGLAFTSLGLGALPQPADELVAATSAGSHTDGTGPPLSR